MPILAHLMATLQRPTRDSSEFAGQIVNSVKSMKFSYLTTLLSDDIFSVILLVAIQICSNSLWLCLLEMNFFLSTWKIYHLRRVLCVSCIDISFWPF